jgi:hypothetical protein
MTRFYSATAQPTTLSAACTNSATSIQVTATTGFPAAEFILALDYGGAAQELVKVTNVAGTTLTVVRGFDSTTAQAHSLGAVVTHVHSADDFRLSRTHEAASTGVHGATGAVVGTTDAQALSNKDLTAGTNTFPASLATTAGAQTLTNKTIALGSNTVSGTLAQLNTAVTDADLASLAGAETLTNKTLTSPTITTPVFTGDFIGGVQYGEKASDQTVSSSTTYVDDTSLQASLAANAVYIVMFAAGYTGTSNTGGLKWQVVGPTGATLSQVASAASDTSFITDYQWKTLPLVGAVVGPSSLDSLGTGYSVYRVWRVKTVGTAGTLKIQFAQNVSHATGATSKAGNFIQALRVA